MQREVRPSHRNVLTAGLIARLGALVVVAFSRTEALAAEGSVISYEAPSDCPLEDAYVAQIARRLGADWRPALEELAQRVNVSIRPVDESYVGTLELVRVGGERFSRVVSGTICSDVVDGLGLMTALAVRARVGEEPEPTKPREVPGEAAPNAPVVQARVHTRPQPTPAVSRRSHAPSSAHLRFGGRTSVASGVGPGVAFGAGAFAALELGRARFGLGADAF